MKPTSQILKSSIGYSSYKLKSSIDYRKKITSKQADKIIESATQLISHPEFKPYFYKTLYIIGPVNFTESIDYANKANNVKCRPCIFVNRLKEYRDKTTGLKGN